MYAKTNSYLKWEIIIIILHLNLVNSNSIINNFDVLILVMHYIIYNDFKCFRNRSRQKQK